MKYSAKFYKTRIQVASLSHALVSNLESPPPSPRIHVWSAIQIYIWFNIAISNQKNRKNIC